MKRSLFQKLKIWVKSRFRGCSLPVVVRIDGKHVIDFQGAISQSREGDNLQIVHIPSHSDRVYVYNFEINRILGYLERDFANDLIFVFGKGFCLDAKVFQTYAFDDGRLGCDVEVYNHSDFALPHIENLPYLYGEKNFGE